MDRVVDPLNPMANLRLYVVTFNCGRNLIEHDAFGQHIFDGWQDPISGGSDPPDVIVFNLQEVAPISYAFIGGNYLKPYFDRFKNAVRVSTAKLSSQHGGEAVEYTNLLAKNCGLTALMVFVREDLVDEVQQVNLAEVGVGLSEMGNKGAIGARVSWKVPESGKLMHTTFISAHLAPFEAELQRRDQDYTDIVKGLIFSKEDVRERQSRESSAEGVPLLAGDESDSADVAPGQCGMYMNDTFVVFSGDLNYRTALTSPARDDYVHYPQPRDDTKDPIHYTNLLEKDQLTQQKEHGKTLQGLTEQPIHFPPTYKYHTSDNKPVLRDDDVQEWDWSKHRWPSWCDRVLYSLIPSSKVQAGKYSALPIFRTSDHRPVALSIAVLRQAIADSQLAKHAPAPLDSQYQSRRNAARRKEIVVGIAAYLALTWEGNSLLLGAVCVVLGGIYILKALA